MSVWNGKRRSGGGLRVVNPNTPVQALAEDNPGPAEWVRVAFTLNIPDRPGIWFIRARYAQDYAGNLFTDEGRMHAQPFHTGPLNWWRVDRPLGPSQKANIGAVVVRP